MINLANLRIAWHVLTSSRVSILLTSNDKACTNKDLYQGAIFSAVTKLRESDAIPKPRYDMIMSVLCDPSVIMLSKDDNGTCCVSYDCADDDDFTDLKQCKIE